jgi:hypothetical protein
VNILNQLLTGSDNTTHDIGRWLAALSSCTGLGLQIYAVGWKGQPFDMQAFGIGCAALATGVGAMLKLKADTEPKPKD